MPKKFVGENSKAVAARARKAAAKEAENTKKALEAEEKAWQDDDKQLLKKKQKQVYEYLFIFIDYTSLLFLSILRNLFSQ